jgi:nucleoside-diphosphate-sugar epimerase
MKILVTGASGFIGNVLCAAIAEAGHEVVACTRSRINQTGLFYVRSPELGPEADWRNALHNINTVVHLAGLAHVVGSKKSDHETERLYHSINAQGAGKLAEQCAEAGVKHFIFLSSCHAVAAESDKVLSAETAPHPVSAYGRSKLEAERSICEALSNKACAWTFLRPPLVYGRANKANFDLLLKVVKSGIPLPLASVRNLRSFIYVENLVDVILATLDNPKAFGKTYMPSDGNDVSTPELICAIVKASQNILGLGYSELCAERSTFISRRLPLLFPFPEILIKALGRLPGLGAIRKLTSSLCIDSQPVRKDLDWSPRYTMEEGLRRTLK